MIINDVTYTVTWTVDTDKVTVGTPANGLVTINVDEKATADLNYTLTATIANPDGLTVTKEYKLMVPKYEAMSWEAYIAAKTGDLISEVIGVVTGIVSKSEGNGYNCFFMQDATGGGYYIYGMTQDPITDLGLEIGMTVSVTGGVKDIYNGTHEIKPSEQGLNVTVISAEKTPVTPLDYTKIFTDATSMKDEALVKMQSSLVTIKGVEITDQDLSNGYLNFRLNGNVSYLRISSSTLGFKQSDAEAFKKAHAEKSGYYADVTGIISQYNNAFYLVPVSTNAFVYGAQVPKTPEQKVQDALSALKVFAAVYNKNTSVDLPAANDDVTFAWVSNGAAGVVEAGKLNITIPEADTDLTVTVTATCGTASDSKTFTLKLSNFPDTNTFVDLVQANKMGVLMNGSYTEGKYFVTGEIVSIDPDKNDNTKLNNYGNMTIKDKDGNTFYLYGLYTADGAVRFDKMNPQPKVGDTITVYGVIGSYKGAAQMKNGWLVTVPAENEELSLPAANTIGLAQGHNTYTANKVVVTGEITEIASTKYGNMTIKDEKGNTLYLYGLYVGETRYDSMEVKPVVGDTITVCGIVGQYNGTAQIKNGQMTKHTAAAPEQGDETPAAPEAGASATISFADTANRTVFTTEQQVWVQNGITVTNDKGASTSNVADYSAPARFYKNSTLTIACNGMVKIEIDCTDVPADKVDGWLTVTGATATQNGNIITIVFESPVNTFTYEKLSAQVRANSITVYTPA